MRWATNIARKQLLSFGTCIGKFTHGGKFHLVITALDIIAPYAKVTMLLRYLLFLSDCVFLLFFSTRCGLSQGRSNSLYMDITSSRVGWAA